MNVSTWLIFECKTIDIKSNTITGIVDTYMYNNKTDFKLSYRLKI